MGPFGNVPLRTHVCWEVPLRTLNIHGTLSFNKRFFLHTKVLLKEMSSRKCFSYGITARKKKPF